jgi:hypothetical protein
MVNLQQHAIQFNNYQIFSLTVSQVLHCVTEVLCCKSFTKQNPNKQVF